MSKPIHHLVLSKTIFLVYLTFVVFVLMLSACKTKQQAGLFYKPEFNQLENTRVKGDGSRYATLDTMVVLLANLRSEPVAVSDRVDLSDSLTVRSGVLIVPIEAINEKPPKYDTILTVKDIQYRLDLVDRVFPKRIYANMVDIIDSLSIKYPKPIPFLTVAQIKADRQRVLLKADSLFVDLDSRFPVERGSVYNRYEFSSKFTPDSMLQLFCDTTYIQIRDSTTMVKQRPLNELMREESAEIYFEIEESYFDTIIFKRYYRNKDEFKLDMVIIEGGELKLGSSDYDEDERPPYRTQISQFLMGKYEITNEEYCFYLNDVKVDSAGYVDGVKVIQLDGQYTKIVYQDTAMVYKYKPISGYEKFPVVNVSWSGAAKFAKHVYAELPSEAQWEYAARGGVKARKHYIDQERKDYDYVNRYAGADAMAYTGIFVDNSNGKPNPGGTMMPNEIGLYDMCGNVWEWCYDFYSPDAYYRAARKSDPINLTGNGRSLRVNRGGSWSSDAIFCRVTNRNFLNQDEFNPYLGFRIIAPLK